MKSLSIVVFAGLLTLAGVVAMNVASAAQGGALCYQDGEMVMTVKSPGPEATPVRVADGQSY